MVCAVVLMGNGQSVLCVALAGGVDRAALESVLRSVGPIGTENVAVGAFVVSHLPVSHEVRCAFHVVHDCRADRDVRVCMCGFVQLSCGHGRARRKGKHGLRFRCDTSVSVVCEALSRQ